jgi:hypothetical protein
MSSLSVNPKTPEELRPLLHQRLDAATHDELEAVHRMLLEMEARRLFDELGDAVDEDWKTGCLSHEKIAESIQDFRQAHPYR